MLIKIQNVLDKSLGKFISKLADNDIVGSLSESMLMGMPIMLGSAIFSLLANFPISSVTAFLGNIGILEPMASLVNTVNNLTPVTFVALYTYAYTKRIKKNPIPPMLFGLIIYFFLIPSTMQVGEDVLNVYKFEYFAGNGVFVSIVIGITVSLLYKFLDNKNIKLKMPESVPPMVSKSFESVFSGMIIFAVFLGVEFLVRQTSYGNLFTMIQQLIQEPLIGIGLNVPFMIIYFTVLNLLWFFGIHPSALLSLFTPIVRIMYSGNIGAMMQGNPIPYAKEYFVFIVTAVGGSGNLLGLALLMFFITKSKRYKAIRRLGAVPAIFNINEPLMFGMPIVMNPVFLVPMLLSPIISMGTMYILTSIFPVNFNPLAAMSMPWTMPWPITAFVAGGSSLFIFMIIVIILNGLLYMPFYMIADGRAYKEENIE